MIPLLQTARELLQTQPTLHPKISAPTNACFPTCGKKL